MAVKWETKSLADLYEFSSGLSKPSTAFGSGDGFLTFKDVLDNYFVPTQLSGLVNSTVAEQAKCSIKRGDVFLTRTSETQPDLGMSSVALIDYPGATFNGFTKRLRLKFPDVVVPEYAAYYFRGPKFRQAITSMSTLSTRASLNNEMLSRLTIDLPSYDEQRAISAILKALDDKIENNRRMNETLEAMARAIFKSWFVDFNPVHARAAGRKPAGMDAATAKLFPDSFVDSPLGKIPKGWDVKPLYDIATYINGAAYQAFQPNEERRGLPIVKIAELKAGITDQTRYSDVEMPEKYRIRCGDILFSWSGNPDTSIDTFVWCHDESWLNQHIFLVIPLRQEDREFVLSTLRNFKPIFTEIARNKQTTGLGHVTTQDMKRLLVVIPDERMLRVWHQLAGRLQNRAFRCDVENQTLSNLRDALLPKLLSGELRVKDAEKFIWKGL